MATQLVKVRKVRPSEIFYEIAQREFKMLITCYWLKLGSKQKLMIGQVEEALKILFRFTDNLSLCLHEEEGDTWFCRMDKEVIDFEVIRNKPPSDVLDEEMSHSFNSKTGPLWRAKYIESDDHEHTEQTEESQNKSEDGTEKLHFEFESHIVFAFNHVMSDGFTAFNICNSFLKALNDVVGGTVQSSYNFGKLNDGSESDEQVATRLEFLEKNPVEFDKVKAEIYEINKDTTILGDIFPVPEGVINKTKHIRRDLDKETTSKLIKVFKENGVSFHAGFTALTNWALLEVLTENGYSSDSLDIGVFHTLNLRRYWKKYPEMQLGSNVGGVSMKTKTERNVGDRFWEYAQEIHSLLKQHIVENRPIDEAIMQIHAAKLDEKFDIQELIKNLPTPKLYYSTTNMGEVASMLQGRGKHVSVNWLTRCTSAHSGHICVTHISQTYEGRFLYGLGYYTKFVRDDFAQMYVDKIFDKIFFFTK